MEAGGLVKARLEGWAGFHPPSRPITERPVMNQPVIAGGKDTGVLRHEAVEPIESILARQTVVVATAESAISASMRDLLQEYPLRTLWVRGVDEVRVVLARETVAACFCGFWLIDGTYRDVVRHLKRQPVQIPAIVVCAPSCPQEYRDYLAALNLRAFDFLCHPYRKADLERILRAAISERGQSVRVTQDSVRGVAQQAALRKAG
jgi:DNA-binding NtrC family response regulator